MLVMSRFIVPFSYNSAYLCAKLKVAVQKKGPRILEDLQRFHLLSSSIIGRLATVIRAKENEHSTECCNLLDVVLKNALLESICFD